jgi:hypothetical protein
VCEDREGEHKEHLLAVIVMVAVRVMVMMFTKCVCPSLRLTCCMVFTNCAYLSLRLLQRQSGSRCR